MPATYGREAEPMADWLAEDDEMTESEELAEAEVDTE